MSNLITVAVAICFTATASFGSYAQNENCRSALLAAVDIEKFNAETNTAWAHRFMQVMSGPLHAREQLEDVSSQLFNDFVIEFLPELVENHKKNKDFIKGDKIPNEHQQTISENFASIDRFIFSIQQRLADKKLLRYVDFIAFSHVLTLSRARKALVELEGLAKNPQLLLRRYPELKIERITKAILSEKSSLEFFWTVMYVSDFDLNKTPSSEYSFKTPYALGGGSYDETPFKGNSLHNLLMLPTLKSTGYAAYFATFHLPLSPVQLASGYEVIDNDELASPIRNFLHDVGHFNSTTMRFNNTTEDSYVNTLILLGEDLKKLKRLVQAENDPVLLNVLYFVFYQLKFESNLRIQPSLEDISRESRLFFGREVFDHNSGNFGVNVERAIRVHKITPDVRTFFIKMAKIQFLMGKMQLAKEHSVDSEGYQQKLKSLQQEYQEDLQNIPAVMHIPRPILQ